MAPAVGPRNSPLMIGTWVAAVAVGAFYGNYKLAKLQKEKKDEHDAKQKKEVEDAYKRGREEALRPPAPLVSDKGRRTDEFSWIDYVDELTDEDFTPQEY